MTATIGTPAVRESATAAGGGATPTLTPACAAWRLVPSPNAGTGSNYLYDVAAVAANDIWAVGYYTTTGNIQQTLTLHWDGLVWTHIPSPSPGPTANQFFGVAFRAPDDGSFASRVDTGSGLACRGLESCSAGSGSFTTRVCSSRSTRPRSRTRRYSQR